MTICPACEHENTPGADYCEVCETPLTEMSGRKSRSAFEKGVLTQPISTLSPRKPVVVGSDKPVGEVMRLLVDQRIGCVIIVENDIAVGIFSERDALIRVNVRFAELASRPIAEFMTSSPETLKMDDQIAFALHRMDLGGYRHIPILDQDRITGVISVRDILRFLAENIMAPEAA